MIEQSESIGKLAGAMLKAQKQVKHPIKNRENTFHKNKYADLTAVIDAVVPVFNAFGITVTQFLTADRLCTQLTHESGEWLRSEVELPCDKKGPQAFGSALTYLRRYTLQAIAGVNAETDDDAEGATAARKGTAPTPTTNRGGGKQTKKQRVSKPVVIDDDGEPENEEW